MIRRAIAAASLAAAALALTSPTPAGAQTAPATTVATGPTLTLIDQPIAVAPDGDFSVFVQVDDAPTATDIAVDIFGAVQPGEPIGPDPGGGGEGTFPVQALPAASGGAPISTLFTISLYAAGEPNPDPAWGWPIDEPGVYPVRVRLLDGDGNRLQTLMTSLIRLPGEGQQVTKTGAALLIGMHGAPPEDPEERAAPDQADTDLLDQLDPLLAVLDGHPTLPATFSITPDTLARVGGDEEATEQLARLRAEVASDERSVLDAAYVDVNVASLANAGLADNLALQRDFGRQTIADLLEPPVTGTWQLRNRVDESALAQLRTRGITRTLLPGDALAEGAGVLAPVDLPSGGGTTRAAAQSSDFVLGLDPRSDPVLAAHQLLARLASTGGGPTGDPAVVVTVDPALATDTSLQIVTDALAVGTPFFAATDVEAILDAEPATGGSALTPVSQPELGSYPATYRQASSSLASYQSMVGGRRELITPYELTLTVSASQDLALAQRRDDAASVTSALEVPFTAIATPEKDKVTLGADDATFPLPITSELDYQVKVVIELESNDRVRFPKSRVEKILEPGKNQVPIRVQTRAAGDTPVRITVRSPDDGVILAESQYTIRSTAVSGVGIVLTVGAALFLAVWWGRHWRRARTRRVTAADPDDATAAADAPSEPETPAPV
ncbi:MAG: hypothetical protein JWO77_875 [Ilumatobacteraceae bacterium]|nr:hypothetical protein [Ilumatobacteraceae bacterium]